MLSFYNSISYVSIMFAKQDTNITTSREIHRSEGKLKSFNSTAQRELLLAAEIMLPSLLSAYTLL